MELVRHYKNEKSFYWPNIKKHWEREEPPALDALEVLGMPEEYVKKGAFDDKYKKPEGKDYNFKG